MLTEELTTYDSWDLQKPSIPKRSRLYQLEPVGIGTPYIESLTSYVARLSESHSVLPGVLISREIASLVKKIFIKETDSRGLSALFNRATALNGTGDVATDLVQALQRLTLREDLHFLTLLFWAKIVPTRNLFRNQKAWCAVCYENWRLRTQVIYEPLLWTISSVKVCSLHQIHLCCTCPHCYEQLPLLSWRTRPGYCSNCGEWLGINLNAETSIELLNTQTLSKGELQWHTWVVRVIGELFSSTPSFKLPPSQENIAKSLSLIIERVTEGNIAAFARLLEIPKNTLWMWQSGKALPQLDTWLKICYCLEISLLEFLNIEQLGDTSFSVVLHKGLRASPTPRVSPKTFNSNQVRNALLIFLQNEQEPPLTMKEVAKRLGYDRRTIFRHFPDLCHAISDKYRNYRKACYAKKIEQSCEEVQQIVLKLHHQAEYPSEARVSELMTNPGYLRYKQVRATLNETRRKLGV
ncbi:MAG: TniQ family protein [Scytonema sp. PMC 1069.18]|nr:TniQ family protein [Scytonema sp. PMC 1069.18]MEC4883075.1 TniQ family protein [Scytonema sp. PMC 1070.18]